MSRLVPRVVDSGAAAVMAPVVSVHARRATHPWAWWVWAIGAGDAVSMTHNLVLIVAICAAVTGVVYARRSDAPWGRAMPMYLVMAAFIVVMRLFFQITLGGIRYGQVLFVLPQLQLPDWAAGIRIGGPVTLEGLVYTGADAGRLGAIIICVGAANALANPKKALRSVPSALYEVSTALVIAMTLAPQLVDSLVRVRRARRLRGGQVKGLRGLGALIIPVIHDAVERSMSLAAGMESRGFGSTRNQQRVGRGAGVAMLAALVMLSFAAFALLSLRDGARLGLPALVAGVVAAVIALRVSGRRLAVSRYQPSVWGLREWVIAAAGVGTVIAMVVMGQISHDAVTPPAQPASWPPLHPVMLVVLGCIAAPIAVTKRPQPGGDA